MGRLLDHIDLRVRNRAIATVFYDPIFRALGAEKSEKGEYTTWRIAEAGGPASDDFGIVEETDMLPGSVRIALRAPSREVVDAIARILPSIGARDVEMDDGIYGDMFYGVFFADPDGNRLEVCVQ
jgi:catechol 2,3-dioxygenase-like lactoylglutathione lyase family enzyme